MPVQEERLSNLERAHKEVSEAVKDINHYVTMIYGVVGKQEIDVKDVKLALRAVNERLESQDKKLDQILALLSSKD
jgi:gag gene protein p17 (matrix protein).